MSKPASTQTDPWVPRTVFDTLHGRCGDAETCLKRLLVFIDETVLDRHAGDWKAATAEILQEEAV